jgi:putative zinc finger/helix-turn-helix YgiT family protein
MKASDKYDCIACGEADLVPGIVELTGTVKDETYKVQMMGLRCQLCGFQTFEGSGAMTEFRRLINEEYKRAHGLLTSAALVSLRNSLDMNQEEFARHVDVGLASLKRWELGKIQEQASNDRIIEKLTKPVSDMCEYAFSATGTTEMFGGCYVLGSATFVTAFTSNSAPEVKKYINNMAEEYRCPNCKETSAIYADLVEPPTRTVPAFMAHLLPRGA